MTCQKCSLLIRPFSQMTTDLQKKIKSFVRLLISSDWLVCIKYSEVLYHFNHSLFWILRWMLSVRYWPNQFSIRHRIRYRSWFDNTGSKITSFFLLSRDRSMNHWVNDHFHVYQFTLRKRCNTACTQSTPVSCLRINPQYTSYPYSLFYPPDGFAIHVGNVSV